MGNGAALMVIISLSDREVIDHLRGDSLIEKCQEIKSSKNLFSPKCSSLSFECCSPSHQALLLREEAASAFS